MEIASSKGGRGGGQWYFFGEDEGWCGEWCGGFIRVFCLGGGLLGVEEWCASHVIDGGKTRQSE